MFAQHQAVTDVARSAMCRSDARHCWRTTLAVSRWWRPKAGTDGSRLTAAEGLHMKNPLSPTSYISRCASMFSPTTGGWLRSRPGQFARARRPTAER